MNNIPSFREAFLFWVKLGFISFGGPAGQIAIMHEYVVEQKRWISESRFMHALNYCMLLPGPEAQQLATYIGWLMHGVRGGLVAGIFFVLPSMFILLGLSIAYVSYGEIPMVNALFTGLKPAVIAIVILALIKIGKKSLISTVHWIFAIAAFVLIFYFDVPFPIIILTAIFSGYILSRYRGKNALLTRESLSTEQHGKTLASAEGVTVNPRTLLLQALTGIVLWIIPVIGFKLLTVDFVFWKTLVLFFTKAALVTFGGAYAVLPYVAQVSVEKYQWLNELQMIDGLALGETTPGPLIMVLAFVGFMAGFNHFNGSLGMGSIGLITTVYYTFLPCFLFIFLGAPLLERSFGNEILKKALGFVTAAVVGVICNLAIFLGKVVLFPGNLSLSAIDFISLAWVIVSVIAMHRFKVGMIAWILVSAVFGILRFWIGL